MLPSVDRRTSSSASLQYGTPKKNYKAVRQISSF
ncbi:hypothetical protein BDFB_013618 [Asbolus verrucosus]|uniref:Uncharacterized protein n=1 Tax=Asbolus verrucosus TaxID=1661398 RepID=A0A482WB60_ASBVE|nr:hypothetical protein BDFB_013618 [Asbolus verrucosus]